MSAAPTADDLLAAYMAVQQRVAAVVAAGDCDRPVPACEGWTVHDVVAHLAGLCQDWVTGRLDGYASDAWTEAQVGRFSASSCAEVLESWAAALGPFGLLTEPFLGLPPARWAFGDAVVHEADIRGALATGRVPQDAVRLGLGGLVVRWEREVLPPADLLPLEIRTPDLGAYRLGDGGSPPAVDVDGYELFRALTGRRSARQVLGWGWTTDPTPFVEAGLPYPFRWATEDLVD